MAIAVNGRKAAADLNAGLPSQATLEGTVSGDQVTLTSGNGVRLTGSVSSAAVFGMITALGEPSRSPPSLPWCRPCTPAGAAATR